MEGGGALRSITWKVGGKSDEADPPTIVLGIVMLA
jgi:hypothetical protein